MDDASTADNLLGQWLKKILTGGQVMSYSHWLYYLGVSTEQTQSWFDGRTIPMPNTLVYIERAIREKHKRCPGDLMNELCELLDRPIETVTPLNHWIKTAWPYIRVLSDYFDTGTLEDVWDEIKKSTIPHDKKEEVLRQVARRCRLVIEKTS